VRILLVEPENNTGAYLRKGLMENGFAVDVARHTSDAVDLTGQTNYDLLVYDGASRPPGLPLFHAGARQTPVLFLTMDNGGQFRKPIPFSDLLTQVRSMLHSWPGGVEEILEIADLRVDLVRHRATRAGVRMDLTPKEYLLLSLLMRKSGEVLSRALIADQVWDINFESNTNFVDVHIRRLRSKVDDPFLKKLIHTVRGTGYVLENRG
jgi:two-component system, OmpR family, copper resistance phosphate regulon response regulator CusR